MLLGTPCNIIMNKHVLDWSTQEIELSGLTPNASVYARGRYSTHLLPGSVRVYDRGADMLVPCTSELCAFGSGGSPEAAGVNTTVSRVHTDYDPGQLGYVKRRGFR